MSDSRLSNQIEQSVQEIRHKSQLHYSTHVLTTRCLPQTELNMTLINVPSNDGLASYSVSYRQSSSLNSAPLGIDIRVTPNDKNIMDRVARFLSPDEHTRTDFLFHYPLNTQLFDWQQLNIKNGCIK